jgi:hypothetical protein
LKNNNSIFIGSRRGLLLQPICYTLKNEKIFCGQNYEFIMTFIKYGIVGLEKVYAICLCLAHIPKWKANVEM